MSVATDWATTFPCACHVSQGGSKCIEVDRAIDMSDSRPSDVTFYGSDTTNFEWVEEPNPCQVAG